MYSHHRILDLLHSYFYQPAVRFACGWLVLRLLCGFHFRWYIYICASALITCAIITSRTLLPCDLTLVDFRNLDSCLLCSLRVANSKFCQGTSIVQCSSFHWHSNSIQQRYCCDIHVCIELLL